MNAKTNSILEGDPVAAARLGGREAFVELCECYLDVVYNRLCAKGCRARVGDILGCGECGIRLQRTVESKSRKTGEGSRDIV
jgi:hypothetical protein